ncbi:MULTISPECIES: OprD family porin [Pseudomonas]|jgi:imipenem/basic amino acid-specific outer membrane pore|uniref:Imipenem/basic amino acid-specific outer membrane pore n=1 Tax=Pseudomonas extremorientalis TaxID=169669 RepID=A0A1H0PUG3_9PSED|nr:MULTISPECIES: OprD family porin [Pseudomonas]KAB0521996.1 OprD family porin [Pseudomonas extremorientalis]OIN10821.1 porin [Pseudomonas extremorientalis]PMV23082.1 outer membrane porin, OprD family [Pseudomonas sp. FW305-3-2-15-C-TSA2]PMV29722.1 outer membrane porin, OprD family [Pseudomonas sp. DP16D-L5]PMV39911.1 outer membrane porin, OprD family [Pseudomonas sp. FW305-3-2-15-A-LB2]
MRVMKWSMIALAVSAGTSQFAMASAQDDSKGFVEDSTFSINTRALYFSRDFRNEPLRGYEQVNGKNKSRAEETGLGFNALYQSGFTQGTIGVGVDVIGLLGVKLDSGKGRAGTGLFPTGADGRSQDDYSKGGGAVKFRISDTVLKVGDQYTTAPVFASDDSRLLPELPQGISITSNEIKGLKLEGGHFTSSVAQNQTFRDSLGLTKTDFAGAVYSFTPEVTGSLYYAKTEDYFRKWYSNLNWTHALSNDQSFALDFNIYDTKSDGEGKQRAYYDNSVKLDNRAFSLQGAYTIGAHTFTLAAQKVTGDGDYGYGVDGGGSVFLANSIARSDFNAEGEKSYQARYDINMATFGIPGLSFMTRYVTGSGAQTATTSNGKEWERDIEAKYVIQSGPAKDLSLRLRQATYRSGDGVYYGSPSIDELRLIANYPLNIL